MDKQQPAPVDKPQNGLAGLKHWRHDLVAGLMVSLVSLPFSLGIAVASGAPPVAGLISAIIAGLIYPFLGGSYVTISGPAAGLAPALLAGMLTLGHGNVEVGYPLLLGVICLVGCVQIVLCLFKAARFSALFPSAVVEGMLAAIGLLIIAKELPYVLGRKFESHEFFGIVLELPRALRDADGQALLLGGICLALLFALGATKRRYLKVIPPPLTVVLVGITLGQLLGMGARQMIHVPDNPFGHGLVLPDFDTLLATQALWWSVLTIVVTLTLIDGVESLATIAAIDKIDPYKRKSQPNRTLLAMGISNICSSLGGGLTIIPGGVKSTVCIVTGGRTLWANFYNALFLVAFLFLGSSLINLIPLSALGAIVIYIGYKLCRPAVWRHVAHIGSEQLLVFSMTVVATLLTDLLWGILFGMVVKLGVCLWLSGRASPGTAADGLLQLPRRLAGLFRNPVSKSVMVGETYHVYFDRPLVCFNLLQVRRELANIPAEAHAVKIHLLAGVTLIDHTSCENLLHFAAEHQQVHGVAVDIADLDGLEKRSEHLNCMRLAPRPAAAVAASPSVVLNGKAALNGKAVPNGKAGAHPGRNGNGKAHPASRVRSRGPVGALTDLGADLAIRALLTAEEDEANMNDPLGYLDLTQKRAANPSAQDEFARFACLVP